MEETTVERSIDLDAGADDVWTALTDDDALSTWFGGDVEIDLTPGGAGRFEDADGVVRRALVEQVDDGHRLAFRWWVEGDDEGPISTVTFELEPVGQATRLVVTERALLVGSSPRAVAAASVALHAGCDRLQARFAACRV